MQSLEETLLRRDKLTTLLGLTVIYLAITVNHTVSLSKFGKLNPYALLTFLPTYSLNNHLLESPWYTACVISTILGTLVWYGKEECVKESFLRRVCWGGGGGGHACGFLFNFSKLTENAIITIKLLIFFHNCSDVAIGPFTITKLKYHRLLCNIYYWYQPLITINKPEVQRFCLSCLELNAV